MFGILIISSDLWGGRVGVQKNSFLYIFNKIESKDLKK